MKCCLLSLFFTIPFNLKAISININGLRDADKRISFLQWLSHLSPSFVCLQECHAISAEELSAWFSQFGYLSVGSFGSARSCGVAILYRPCFSASTVCAFDGHFVLAEFTFRDMVFRVACCYAPNRNPDRDTFLTRCADSIDASIPTLLCGDFNTVLDRALDRRGSCPFDSSRESSSLLSSLFLECCVVDIWRLLHPSVSAFSWSRRDNSLASRIDLIGCPYLWIPYVSAAEILPCPFSDHSALSFGWTLSPASPPGPRLWKLNTAILEDTEYYNLISDFWSTWQSRRRTFSSLTEWWDQGKSRIKGLTINYCKARGHSKRLEHSILSNLASHLKTLIDSGQTSLSDIYNSTLSRIKSLDLEAARGLQVRARVKWVEEGESSSSFFLRLVKKQSVDRYISALRSADGSLVSGKDGLCHFLRSFYLDLFSDSPCVASARDDLLANVSSVLPSDQSCLCEGLLSQDECHLALRGMARGKAPGCDGLPMEFYLKFWSVLGSDLVSVLNSAFFAGVLSRSQRRGVITLSFKKGDRLDPRNWRPITLLNVDYKIASRAVAGRLLMVLHLVVSRDQTCGVPGRFIGESVAFIRDCVHYCSSSGVPAALVSLDQEKAFDRVNWSFLRATLRSMGFGPSFIGWVDLFYNNVRSSVNVNGHISKSFPLSRGVRQGCPLSPLLYVLVIEVLACNVRANPSIRGLCLPGCPSLLPCISLYADDASLVVSSFRSIKEVFSVFSRYERGSGAKLNLAKCKGLWLGPWNGHTDSPVDIEWHSDKIKILGVFVGPGDLDESNWRPRITAVEHVLSSWRQRSLSYSGKSLIINALALSRVWYVASLVHVPRWASIELNSLIFKFFWGGKRDLVARRVVVQHRSLGGFSVVDFQSKVSALLVQWVRRFSVSPAAWVFFMSFWFSSVLGCSPRAVFSSPGSFPLNGLPPFYRSVVTAWLSCGGSSRGPSFGIGRGVAYRPSTPSLPNLPTCSFFPKYLILLTALRNFAPCLVACTGVPPGASFSCLAWTAL